MSHSTQMMDPSNVFKDAVDGLLRGVMTPLSSLKDVYLRCLALMWHSILSWQLPTGAQAVYLQEMMAPSNAFKDASDGLFQALWRLWMVQMKYLDLALSWYDIPFLVNNCQLRRRLSTPFRWRILQMSAEMQLTGCSRASWVLTALNSSKDVSCCFLAVTWHMTRFC